MIIGYKLIDTIARVGENVELCVNFNGTPPPFVRWALNDWDILQTDRVKIVKTEFSTGIKIQRADKSDAGTYKLTLSNPAGDIKTSCRVNIHGKLHVCSYVH